MVIVGAGKAGARAIVGFREFGWQGPVVVIGEETLAAYDRPPLSKAAIAQEEEPQPTYLLDDSMMASLKADWRGGVAATSIDRKGKAVVLANGERVPYHKLLIATGAKPRKLNLPGAERAMMLRDFDHSVALRQSFRPGVNVAIIGGGFIGLELAATARKRGCTVTLIEAQPRILMRGVPQEIAEVIAARHKAEGVTLLTGTGIDRIEADAVVLADGRRIAADVVVAGVGAVPETRLAEAAGLAIDNGIACDDHMQTSDPDIYAAGDCCSFPHPLYGGRRMRLEAWRSAQDQAAAATENMTGGDKRLEAVPWFWSDQYDLNLQIAGMPGDGTRTVTRHIKDGAFIVFHLNDDGVIVGASGVAPGNAIARDVRMAEMLAAKKAAPDPALLADPAFQLRTLLKG